ncbi:efflux RND transporter periplasmic adaptor subunit [Segetibacter sp.]|jgi:membrane fusion protein (multidrug efflux system)|uniref:efflux RND transporter periplasmic adaptor subunit n=1 Tax=Segetibacter sp. TaxID=2231182 RepID=UPI00261A37D0|nr:efflux RND transporter periplasmic adaptor subunit [Segetibacter sp.]MCW3080673.1 efflux transporter periplasmic adaptor subunit [Segetibacter sp.]
MKYAFLSIVLLNILAFSCKGKTEEIKKIAAPPPTVDVIIASSQTIPNTVEANGTVVAGEFVEIRPEISGRLTYLNVAEGSRIAKGSVVAKINDADLRAQLNKVNVQLQLAEITVARFKKLLDIQGINRADYDVALNQVNSLRADIGIIQANLAKTVVRSPFSGVVGLRQVSNGAIVSPTTVLATLQQMGKIRIDFTLPENYANLLKRGNSVVVEMGAPVGKRRATIIAIEPQISTTTRNVIVRARLVDATNVNPGSFVKVYVDAGKESGMMIPANAIIPEARAKQAVIVKNGKAKFVDIETGVRQVGAVQVTKGLNAGDSVVISGVLFARPNAAVKVRSVKKLEDIIK